MKTHQWNLLQYVDWQEEEEAAHLTECCLVPLLDSTVSKHKNYEFERLKLYPLNLNIITIIIIIIINLRFLQAQLLLFALTVSNIFCQ